MEIRADFQHRKQPLISPEELFQWIKATSVRQGTPGSETCSVRLRGIAEHRELKDSKRQRRAWRQTLRSAAFPSRNLMPDPVASPTLPDSSPMLWRICCYGIRAF
ncbi:hypothetical protein TNCV_2212401 [Trichonephila clavipes]|nr:hypothetical protein TNCV_2212401 [Trichonephila clavipes]